MVSIAIIGCGVVGAAIAYELSSIPELDITLIEQQTPASGSTGAALGVLMGVISQKKKGRAWRLRQISLERYETLIPELENLTGQQIPFNRQGILKLMFAGDNLAKWEKLIEIRRNQGWQLELWHPQQLQSKCPQLEDNQIIGAIYSPQDRQVHPTILTQTLIAGAVKKGVKCKLGVKVEKFNSTTLNHSNLYRCCEIYTPERLLKIDWLIITAGLGSTPLTNALKNKIDIRPVLGQALQLKLTHTLGNNSFQPVITGGDVHIVPLDKGEYWVGATVEFPNDQGEIIAQPQLLEKLKQKAIAFCPKLAEATIIRSWSGKRPRPEGQAAPIISKLSGYSNVLLASGHYRNGVLLAPATAQVIKDKILDENC